MTKAKILVTGACGYIGRWVVRELLDQGYHVIASDCTNTDLDERAEFCSYSIFNGEADVYEHLGRPDALIHLAWRNGFVHNDPAHMLDLSKHICFLNHMIDAGLPKLLVMGSMHEVGYWEGAIDENTPCKPLSQYGISKNALRESLMLYVQGKETKLRWLRAYYIYSNEAVGSSIFAKIVQASRAGKTTFPFTSGKNKYDFIHISLLAKQIVAAMAQDEHDGIINVCSGLPVPLAEKVESFIEENMLNISLDYGAFPDRPYDSPCVWGDASIIQSIMNKEQHTAERSEQK